ncbi:MAG: NAD(P)H-dependent glycerol-3-phosphate dehydrogenase [Bacteroidetes bacterium]|nr:NAD(P)H-dependent glycerol-3-phosphate dehydrogenase [Bacteroidota bacterium]
MKISVLGAGGWGTTLAILLYRNGYNTTLWEFNKEYAETLKEYRENFYYLPKVKIPRQIHITSDAEEALTDKDILLFVVPTQYIRNSFKEIKGFDLTRSTVISASKGIEVGSYKLVSDILSDTFRVKKSKLACLSGPSHAEEVSRKIPTTVTCAANDIKLAKQISKIFSNDYFRVYSNSDLIGTELAGALKNVIAIAAGISDGAGFGDNTKAALMTRGMREIMRLGMKLKAKKETFFGLAGIGDLIVTCSSRHSRNRYVGEQVGRGKRLDKVLKEMKMVAEGVPTTKSAYELSRRFGIELPITEMVYRILFKGVTPHNGMFELMTRKLKTEHEIKDYHLT